jgi:hypothetical protein
MAVKKRDFARYQNNRKDWRPGPDNHPLQQDIYDHRFTQQQGRPLAAKQVVPKRVSGVPGPRMEVGEIFIDPV